MAASRLSSLPAPWPRAVGKQHSPAGRLHAHLSRQRLAANAHDATYNAAHTAGRLQRHVHVGAAWGACITRALAMPVTTALDAVVGTGRLHRTVRAQGNDVWAHSDDHPCSSGLLLRAAWGVGDLCGQGNALGTLAWAPLEGARWATAALKGALTGVGMAAGALLGLAAGGCTELFERTPLERLTPWRALRDAARTHLRAHAMHEAQGILPTPAASRRPPTEAAFSTPVAEALQAVFGQALRRDELVAKYRPLLPHAHWTAKATARAATEQDPACVVLNLAAFDHRGKVIATLQRTATKHADDSVELHSSNMYLAPRYRGRALTARCEAMEEAWLRATSKHPRTRLSLCAGYACSPLTEGVYEHSGYYVHALHGYQFAETAGLTPKELRGLVQPYGPRTPDEPMDSTRSDRELMTARFAQWLEDRQHWLQIDGAFVTPEAYAALRAEVNQCEHPWEFAQVGASAAVTFSGVPVATAFMTTAEMTHWRGVRFVNGTQDPAQAKVRALSAAAYARSAEAELERSARREAARNAALVQRLDHISWKERLGAYKELVREGDAGWERALRVRAPQCASLERAKLEEALDAIRGQRVMAGLSERAERPGLSPELADFLLDQRNEAAQQV